MLPDPNMTDQMNPQEFRGLGFRGLGYGLYVQDVEPNIA